MRATQRWLAGIRRYHAVKYVSQSQEMSLSDIYRLTRPNLVGEANSVSRYLVQGDVDLALTHIADYKEFTREAQQEPPPTPGQRLYCRSKLLAEYDGHGWLGASR